jgi:hypothetical protein
VFFQIPFLFTLSNQKVPDILALLYYGGELLMYPLNTAFRRIVCQVFHLTDLAHGNTGHDSGEIHLSQPCSETNLQRVRCLRAL